MLKKYDAIYLSPHLDDAALSCGGQIIQRVTAGQSVLIATFMAADPPTNTTSEFATHLHNRWELAESPVAARRAEDIAACQILKADWYHGRWADCIYRLRPGTDQTMYHSNADIFGTIDPAEQAVIVPEITADLQNLPEATEIIAPLTIGNHVDHQLIRHAAEKAFGATNLRYYEDYPYARSVKKREAVLNERYTLAQTWQLSEAETDIKCHSITAYQSQISTFFADFADMKKQIIAYQNKLGGEKVWRYQLTTPPSHSPFL